MKEKKRNPPRETNTGQVAGKRLRRDRPHQGAVRTTTQIRTRGQVESFRALARDSAS